MRREHTDPPHFWMSMRVDNARTFVSVARQMGYSCWIDERPDVVTIWPDIYEVMEEEMLGLPPHICGLPKKLRINRGGYVAVFNDEYADYSTVWAAVKKLKAEEEAAIK